MKRNPIAIKVECLSLMPSVYLEACWTEHEVNVKLRTIFELKSITSYCEGLKVVIMIYVGILVSVVVSAVISNIKKRNKGKF